MDNLPQKIEALYKQEERIPPDRFEPIFQEFVDGLNRGDYRAAEPENDRWKVNSWVKQGILLGFRYGKIRKIEQNSAFYFSDKHTFPTRPMEEASSVRVVPGGTTIRTGSFIGESVVIMPPAYVNTGAYIGHHTMIDSHALVGSCAQIGSHVHLSAGAQIGGVLEPIGALPVIIEGRFLVGGGRKLRRLRRHNRYAGRRSGGRNDFNGLYSGVRSGSRKSPSGVKGTAAGHPGECGGCPGEPPHYREPICPGEFPAHHLWDYHQIQGRPNRIRNGA